MSSKIKLIEPSRFIDSDSMKEVNGGSCTINQMYQNCPTDPNYQSCSQTMYVLCDPAVSYYIIPCYNKLSCGDINGGIYQNCTDVRDTCPNKYTCRFPDYGG
ncbi:MAG: hypothetical protein SPH95_02355 [Candidatus Aphodosoma sp.]|nr:hypothetical protein [Candidatus Aphodosoma sp.]